MNRIFQILIKIYFNFRFEKYFNQTKKEFKKKMSSKKTFNSKKTKNKSDEKDSKLKSQNSSNVPDLICKVT